MDSRIQTSPVRLDLLRASLVGIPPVPQSAPPIVNQVAKKSSKSPEKTNRTQEEEGEEEKEVVVDFKKVCEHCGRIFYRWPQYLSHLRTHRPPLKCDVCSYFTKDAKKFRSHKLCHLKGNPKEECSICKGRFVSRSSVKSHMRRMHNVIECKLCQEEVGAEEPYEKHLQTVHNVTTSGKDHYDPCESKSGKKSVNIFRDPQPFCERSEFVCRLCNKGTRNKYQLKIHIAQHLGVTSEKISDEFLATQDVQSFEYEISPCSFEELRERLQKQNLEIPIREESPAPPPPPCEHNNEILPLDIPIKEEPLDVLDETTGVCVPATSSDRFEFVSVVKQESPECSESDVQSFDELSFHPPAQQNLVTPQPSTLISIHSMILSNPNLMTSIPSTSYGNAPQNFPKSDFSDPYRLNIDEKFGKYSKVKFSKQKQKIRCDECSAEFSSMKSLRGHKVKHKNQALRNTIKCPECDLTHLSAVKMTRHFKAAHRDKLRCRYHCMLLFSTREEVFAHYKEFHNIYTTIHTCPYCGLEYLMEGCLLNHLDRCIKCPIENRPVHVCGNCQTVLPNRREYNIHIEECAMATTGKVKEPTISDQRSSKLKAMEVVGNYRSTDTVYEESQPKEIRKSEAVVKNTRHCPQKCIYCEEEFDDWEVAVRHCFDLHKNLLTQLVTKPHVCPLCGINVENSLVLCKHIINHYQELCMWDDLVPRNLLKIVSSKNYCWICRCTLHGDIKYHLKARDINVEYALLSSCKEPKTTTMFRCTYCLGRFSQRYNFWKHLRGHLAELPNTETDSAADTGQESSQSFECSECLLVFTDEIRLYKHLTTHVIQPIMEVEWEQQKGTECADKIKEVEIVKGKMPEELEGKDMPHELEEEKKADELEGKEKANELEGKEKADELEGKEKADELEGMRAELEGKEKADELQGKEKADELQGKESSDELEGKEKENMDEFAGKEKAAEFAGMEKVKEVEFEGKEKEVEFEGKEEEVEFEGKEKANMDD